MWGNDMQPWDYHSSIVNVKAKEENMDALEKYILNYVNRLVYEEGKTAFIAYDEVRAIVDDIFEGMNLHSRFGGVDGDKKLYFTNGDSDRFSVEELSSGEKQLIWKVFPLFVGNFKNRIILIDEAGEYLHPAWQRLLVPVLRRCIAKNNLQIILATHSPQIISSVKREELRLLAFDENNRVAVVESNNDPYGRRVEEVLGEIMGVPYLRTPEVEEQLQNLRQRVGKQEYDMPDFKNQWEALERQLGYSDLDLVLMRLEIARKRKTSCNRKTA
jgi:hypothetical protein